MKTFSTLLLTATLAIPAFAQTAETNAVIINAAPPPVSNQTALAAISLPASAAVVTAPLVLKDGAISQPETTGLAGGGKAVFSFTITNAGDYLISAQVDAPAEDANSFYVNIDAQPEDPAMIWDVDMTSGFENRVVSWRGKGDVDKSEFVPKHFNLSAGVHKLIIMGREPAQLKSVSIRPAAK